MCPCLVEDLEQGFHCGSAATALLRLAVLLTLGVLLGLAVLLALGALLVLSTSHTSSSSTTSSTSSASFQLCLIPTQQGTYSLC